MPVGRRVGRVVVRCAGRPLDYRVARTGRTVVATVLAGAMLMSARRLQVFSLIAATRATTQEVRATAAWAAGAQEVSAATTAPAPAADAPLELLQLRAVVLCGARHCLRRDGRLEKT